MLIALQLGLAINQQFRCGITLGVLNEMKAIAKHISQNLKFWKAQVCEGSSEPMSEAFTNGQARLTCRSPKVQAKVASRVGGRAAAVGVAGGGGKGGGGGGVPRGTL